MDRLYALVGAGRGRIRRDPAVVLTIGFLALLGALLAAHLAPATSYEVDIYAATPLAFWLGVGVAYLVFLLACFSARQAKTVGLALLLGGGATLSIAGLPLIRDYHYYGHSDPLTHLGWVRAIDEGALDTLDFIYPGSHSLAAMVHELTGFEAPFAMMLVVTCFVSIFLLFVPLSIYALTGDMRATACGGFSAFLLLPINNIATGLPYFPFLLATFFFTLILYLVIKHVTFPSSGEGRLIKGQRRLPTSAVIPITTAAVLFFHPQVTMDVVAVLGAIVAVQLLVRWRRPSHPLADTRILAGQFLFLFVIFYIWSSSHGAAVRTADQVVNSIEMFLSGGEGGEFAHTASSRQQSAEKIGVTIWELFVKLFLMSAVYIALSGVAAFVAFRGRYSFRVRGVSTVVVLLVFGCISLAVVSLLHTFGGVSSYLYRHIGFGMLLMTVLGSLGLAVICGKSLDWLRGSASLRGLRRTLGDRFEVSVRAIAVLVGVTALIMSLAVVHTSPYMYNPGSHVTEEEIDGYEVALQHKPSAVWDSDEAIWYGGIRRGYNRYAEARRIEYPRERRLIFSGPVPNRSLADLPHHYRTHNETIVQRDHYLPILRYDRDREVVAYRGLRYTREGFDAMHRQPAVHRIQDNGGMAVYYVDIDLYRGTT